MVQQLVQEQRLVVVLQRGLPQPEPLQLRAQPQLEQRHSVLRHGPQPIRFSQVRSQPVPALPSAREPQHCSPQRSQN